MTKDIKAAHKFVISDANYQTKCLIAAGLVRTRTVLAEAKPGGKARGHRGNKTAAATLTALRRRGAGDGDDGDDDVAAEAIVTNARARELAGTLERALGEAEGGVMIDNELKVKMVSELEKGGWDVERLHDRRVVSRIYARVRSYMLESGAAETVLAKVEGHEDKQATPALRLVARGAGGSRVRGGDDEDDAEKDDEDAATFARGGGGALSLESRIEDRVVSMCLAAGESGCKVSDLARMFQIGVKPFGKRVDAMEAQRHVFGVHKHVKLEGKIRVAYLYHDTAVAPPSGPCGDDAAKRLRAARGALICEHLADEGYLVRAYVGRWLAEKEGGDLQPVGKKVMEPIVRDLEEAKALRREFIATSTGGHMNAGSEPHEVLLHPTFPELTDAMREKIRREIVDKERFARTPAWKRNGTDARANGSRAKDVASASASGYAPAPGSALALTSTEPGGDGSSSLVETVTVTVKTAGVRPYMRGRSYGGFIGSRPDDAKARARRARPFRASRDHAVLSLGFNPFLAIRLARLHEFLARAAFFGEKKAKKEKKEAAAAAAAYDEDDDDEDDDDADASPVLFSRELDVSALVTSTMPVDLFLHLAGCPEGLEDADPAMLARLCARAVEDATVGDLDPDEFAALFGDAGGGGAVAADDGDDERGDEGDGNNAGGFAAAMATAQRDKLSRLLRLLCAMGLAERSIRTTSDGRVSITHRLARRGTYGTDPVDANAVASHRVDTPAGLAAYWDGLETTFKGKISGDGCMIGVFPNEHFACAGADHGLCGSKTWTRSRDATAAQRLELLDAFQLARVQAYRIGKMDAGAGADEDEDEDEARAAARAASLKPEVPAVSALEHLANRTGLDVNRVRAFHSADQRRVQEYLVSEGTVSREEVNAAELERETRRKEKSERRRAEEERKRQNRNAARPGRLESVGPSVAAAPSASGFAPAPGALALVSAAAAPPRGNERRPKSEKFFWTPKTDAELVFAVVRSLITRGPEYNLFSGLASRDVKLPADAHRCNVRFQKHVNTGERKGLIEETVALFAARRARGNVRAETEEDDAAAAAEDEPANRWDAEGVWCESVDAELKEKVREMLSVHPPKYRRQHFLGSYDSDGDSADGVPVGRLARSDSDSDDEDEVPLANLVRGTDSDSDSDEDDSDSDSDEDEGGSRALKRARRGDAPVAARARRDFADEPPESRVAFANALELVKMFVMHRVDHPEDDAGKRALRETMVAVGEDAIQRAMETLRRAGLLAGGGDAPIALDARFFQAADDRAVGGGAIADAADAAGDLRAASMPGRTSRCERPTAGQTLALLAAVARARVSLSPAADPASVETLPPTYPANADARETEASDEHLTDAANGLRVRVDGHGGSKGTRPAARAAAGAAAADAYPTPMDAAGPGVDDRGADDVDRVAVSDAAAAACGAGPGGISASELAARTGASVAACEAALRAARDAGDAAEVNAYTEFRYVAEEHAARFRVKHPASLDAAPPPGAAPSPQIRPWLRPDGTTNETFVAGLRRRARGAAIRWPGIPRLNLAGYLVPALTPAVADEFVRGMIERGELIVEMTSAAPETEGAPPPALRSAAANAAAEAAAREAPTAHVFAPQDCTAWG